MCIVCECEKYGVTEPMLHAAHEFITVSQYMLYCICAVAGIANMTAMDYWKRDMLLRKIASEGDEATERAFFAMGMDARRYCAEQVAIPQKQWCECLGALLTAYSEYCMIYAKYWPPVNVIEGTLEYAKQTLLGEQIVKH